METQLYRTSQQSKTQTTNSARPPPISPTMSPTKPAEALLAMAHAVPRQLPPLAPSQHQRPEQQSHSIAAAPAIPNTTAAAAAAAAAAAVPITEQQTPNEKASARTTPTNTNTTTSTAKKRQRRYRANPEQLKRLVALFEENMSPPAAQLAALAREIDMPQQSVVLWFKNRRARVPAKRAKAAAAAAARRKNATMLNDVDNLSATRRRSRNSIGDGSGSGGDGGKRNADSITMTPPPISSSGVRTSFPTRRRAAPPMSLDIPSVDTLHSTSALASPPPRSSPRLREKAAALMQLHQQNPNQRPPPLLMLLTAAGTLESPKKTSGPVRRPRPPLTPRIMSQREYMAGDQVEVLETGKGYVRSWYSARVIEKKTSGYGSNPAPLSLGASAAGNEIPGSGGAGGPGNGGAANTMIGGYNMRTPTGSFSRRVSSPLASPTPPAAKAKYRVQYEHIVTDLESMTPLVEVITASRLRPRPPVYTNWKPQFGEAVEALSNEAAWFTGVVRAYAVRKGFLVSFEGGQKLWYRRNQLRPYQVWRGGDEWIIKTKPPAALARKSAGMSVTVQQQPARSGSSMGRKRSRDDTVQISNTGKRRKIGSMTTTLPAAPSGPEGLPAGWNVVEVTRGSGSIMNGRKDKFYTAPDGRRLRSLKEARRYVRLLAAQEHG